MDNIEKLIKAFQELIVFVNDSFSPALQKKNKTSYLDVVIYFLFTKNYKTFNALYLLCINSYGQDALILSRSIFECFITLAYISKENSEKRAELFAFDGVLKNRKLIIEAIENNYSPNYFNSEILIKFNNQNELFCNKAIELRNEEKKRLKDKWKPNQWAGLSIKDMAKSIGLADFYYWGPYYLLSNQAHSNGNSAIEYSGLEGNLDDEMACNEAIEKSLIMGYDFLLKTLYSVNNVFSLEFNKKIEALEEKYSNLIAK